MHACPRLVPQDTGDGRRTGEPAFECRASGRPPACEVPMCFEFFKCCPVLLSSPFSLFDRQWYMGLLVEKALA